MKTITLTIMTLIASAVLTSCGDNNNESKTETYSYNFNENNCPTEKHSFKSKQEMCDALQSRSLNNYCAEGLREKHFEANCQGQIFRPF